MARRSVPRLLTVDKVSEFCAVAPPRIYALIREGVLPAVRLGRQVRVPEDALAHFIRKGGYMLPGGWRRQPRSSQEVAPR